MKEEEKMDFNHDGEHKSHNALGQSNDLRMLKRGQGIESQRDCSPLALEMDAVLSVLRKE